MGRDRIAAFGKQLNGMLDDAAGKGAGGAELQTNGKSEKAVGRPQTIAGRARDGARGMADA